MKQHTSEITKMNSLQIMDCSMGMCMCCYATFQKVVTI